MNVEDIVKEIRIRQDVLYTDLKNPLYKKRDINTMNKVLKNKKKIRELYKLKDELYEN